MLRKRHIARSAIKSAVIAHTAKRLLTDDEPPESEEQ
jgi:hypothetical protein